MAACFLCSSDWEDIILKNNRLRKNFQPHDEVSSQFTLLSTIRPDSVAQSLQIFKIRTSCGTCEILLVVTNYFVAASRTVHHKTDRETGNWGRLSSNNNPHLHNFECTLDFHYNIQIKYVNILGPPGNFCENFRG